MDNESVTLLTAMVISVILSGFFSATETAYSSINRIKVKNMANNGSEKAEKVLNLLNNYDKLITTVLVGNNIVNILGSSLATVFFLKFFPKDGVTVSTIVMTLVVLIFGEITPKTIAKEMPESFALFVYNIISVLVWILTPINFIFTYWKKFLKSIFHFESDDSVSQDELLTMVEEAQNDGEIDEHDGNLISNAIEFNELEVKDILTPRVDVIAADITDSLEEIESLFRMHGYSRLPIYDESIDNIIGIIHEKDFYSLLLDKESNIKKIMQKVVYTSPYIKINDLLRQLQNNKTHLAVVVDEYGGTAGIITLEDILEELVGEIWDEHDEIIEYYQPINDDTYLISCNANLEEMFEHFDIDMDEEYEFTTVSAWLIHLFDKIPEVGEDIYFKNMHLTVKESDGKTIQSVELHFMSDEEIEELNHKDEEEQEKENSK